ncbi:hypothetical protein [Paenibacillus sp. W2I17]|nr:hypothetical protein [Paenibacillus sp. W2I17]MDQ0661225.1 hypothetical protein [Paenibacillus sp. W2I17]
METSRCTYLRIMNERAGDGGSLAESVFETALGSMNGHGKVGWNEQDHPV